MMDASTVQPRDRLRFARALRSRPFALLWLGQTISSLGDGAFLTALAWQTLLLTGSATAIGLVAIATSVPRLIFLLVGGVTADRLSRRAILLTSDIGRAIATLLIAGLGWSHQLHLWHLLALGFFFGAVDGFFSPAYQSIRPEITPVESLASANALSGFSRQVSSLLGPLLGSGLIALTSAAGAFAFDSATFVFSTVCLVALRIPARRVAPVDGKPVAPPRAAHPLRRAFADLGEGWSYIAGSTWLWLTITVAALGNVAQSGAISVALPKLALQVFGSGGAWLLGVVGAATGVGAIIGSLGVGQVRALSRRGLLAYLGLTLAGLALLVFGLPLPHGAVPYILAGAAALNGLGVAVFSVIWETVLQELVPANKLGRVSSIDLFGSFALLPVGFALAGFFTDRVGPSPVFLASGALIAIMYTLCLLVPAIRNLA